VIAQPAEPFDGGDDFVSRLYEHWWRTRLADTLWCTREDEVATLECTD
jgi:hypothetical protein